MSNSTAELQELLKSLGPIFGLIGSELERIVSGRLSGAAQLLFFDRAAWVILDLRLRILSYLLLQCKKLADHIGSFCFLLLLRLLQELISIRGRKLQLWLLLELIMWDRNAVLKDV